MSKQPQDTSAEEPDGGNPHIRFRGGPRQGDRPGLLNKGLEGKVAIVTGGASGIGAAACRRFVAEGCGVSIGDINAAQAESLAQELGGAAIAIPFDAGDVASV